MTWKQVGLTSNEQSADIIWQPDEGGVLEGVYIGKKEKTGNMQSPMFTFQTDVGVTGVWSSMVLETKLNDVAKDAKVKITYLGRVTGKTGRQYKDFGVEIWVEEDKFDFGRDEKPVQEK